jgi:PilZ domain
VIAMPEQSIVPMRELPARIIEISGSGCLMESRSRVAIGTVGTLQLKLGTDDCEDHVMVVRCDAVRGVGAVYQVGVRFLWTTPPRAGSIRRVVSRYIASLKTTDASRVM